MKLKPVTLQVKKNNCYGPVCKRRGSTTKIVFFLEQINIYAECSEAEKYAKIFLDFFSRYFHNISDI